MSLENGSSRMVVVSTRMRLLLILAVCICWVLLFLNGISRITRPGDDSLYLQSIAVSAKSPSRLAELNQELINSLDALGCDDFVLYPVVLRAEYTNNYWAASYIQSLAATLHPVDVASMTMESYSEAVATRSVLGPTLSGLICVVVLAAGLLLIRNSSLFIAAIFGFAIVASLYNCLSAMDMQTLVPYYPERLPEDMSWIAAFGRTAYFFINPGPEFSIFGTSPRSNFAILSLVAALLRWDGRLSLSYLMLAVAILFHASSGLIVLALFVASNLAFRPSEIARPAPLISIGICVALEFSQESLGNILGLNFVAMTIVLILSLVLAFGLYGLVSNFRSKLVRYASLPNAMFPDRITADFVIFLFLWNASLAMILGRLGYLDFTSVAYLWSQFNVRAAGILQPMLIVAIAVFMLRAIKWNYNWIIPLTLALMLGGLARNHLTLRDPRQEYARNLSKLEARRVNTLPYTRTPSAEDQDMWYYAILRALDFNENHLGLVGQ